MYDDSDGARIRYTWFNVSCVFVWWSDEIAEICCLWYASLHNCLAALDFMLIFFIYRASSWFHYYYYYYYYQSNYFFFCHFSDCVALICYAENSLLSCVYYLHMKYHFCVGTKEIFLVQQLCNLCSLFVKTKIHATNIIEEFQTFSQNFAFYF